MAYAARHPEHIRHLVTVDSAAPRWADTVFLFKDIFPEGQERADSFAFADALGDSTPQRSHREQLFGSNWNGPNRRTGPGRWLALTR